MLIHAERCPFHPGSLIFDPVPVDKHRNRDCGHSANSDAFDHFSIRRECKMRDCYYGLCQVLICGRLSILNAL
jgi:hypothetical protein